MAGRHLKDLITAYQNRDELAFRRATQAIIEEEEAKKHTALARDLRRMLAVGSGAPDTQATVLPEAPRDRDSGVPLADVRLPDGPALSDLVLADELRATLEDVLAEVNSWPALDAAGIPRRNRVLLHGPPGCGKSSIASAVATHLGLPLATARIDSLMSSYLGETAANLRALFEFASRVPCVLLLDEFDSVGKLRDDPGDHGELRRVVNAVLQLVEAYRGSSVIIAATNAPGMIDTALWRRFDEVLTVPSPTPEQLVEVLTRHLPELRMSSALDDAAVELDGLPHAAAESAAQDARRRAVRFGTRPGTDDLRDGVLRAASRPWA